MGAVFFFQAIRIFSMTKKHFLSTVRLFLLNNFNKLGYGSFYSECGNFVEGDLLLVFCVDGYNNLSGEI